MKVLWFRRQKAEFIEVSLQRAKIEQLRAAHREKFAIIILAMGERQYSIELMSRVADMYWNRRSPRPTDRLLPYTEGIVSFKGSRLRMCLSQTQS